MLIRDVCAVSDVPVGEVAGFEIENPDGKTIKLAIVHTSSGNWYALEDRCSHGRVALSTGFVADECIECPRHGAQFDLASGEPLSPPASRAVKTYPVQLNADRVTVELELSPA